MENAQCDRQLDPSQIINPGVGEPNATVCRREAGHRGLHRDSWAIHHDTLKWGDDACLPASNGPKEPVQDRAPVGQPVNDFQVKVWYWSGSAETVSHIDFMAAASIYSEACDNPRARAAEVHCPGGCLAASFVVETKLDTPRDRG